MKQRSDYTFKYNSKIGRHGWLRLTPAYSIKLVQEILQHDSLFGNSSFDGLIIDPFCGTATTGIVAAEMGMTCYLYDINPFLVWFSKIKSEKFDSDELHSLIINVLSDLKDLSLEQDKRNVWIPPMRNIERWWDEGTLLSLATLHKYIRTVWGLPTNHGVYNLLWIAFARLVIESSAADFNHISVSFKDKPIIYEFTEIKRMYKAILELIICSADKTLKGQAIIVQGDSRIMDCEDNKYDLVITSPPYPNRISYIRELRPYMYWLGFLQTGEQAGELDWKAIGGTWGAATSKLMTWQNENKNLPQELLDICMDIKHSDNKNGVLLSHYVLKFFDDLQLHLSNLRYKLNDGAEINYILGNSSFYGNYVKTDSIVKTMLNNLGYSDIDSIIIRKRNCNKGLYEYKICAKWNN
ncbi:MAG: site-specific DNA-methyltransferase [Prevotellaceae bacterium]|nr:site-specific DNA-methyltransferase [Prevotellaceae bacterium]